MSCTASSKGAGHKARSLVLGVQHMAEQIAELQIVRTSPGCVRYALIVAGREV